MMNYQDKTKDELIIELQKLQQEYDSLKTSYEKDITERKQVEESLKMNEALFHELFDNMKSGSVIFTVINDGSKGSDYIIKKFNSVGLKMEGKTLEEVVGKRFIDIRPNIDNYGLIPVMKKVWETGESAILPTRIYIDECYSNYYENYVFKIPSGEVVTLYDDVTESKRAEEALRLEKENFRHSLDDSPLGVRIATIEGNTIYANKTLLNFYGYDGLEELQKTPLKNRYTPESYAEALKRKGQRDRGDFSATDYEISIVRKNGEIRHLQVFRKDVLWAGVRQFQIIYNDITERKLAKEMLQKSELKYRNLIEQTPDAIFIVDAEGNLVHVNLVGQKMLGYTEDELHKMKTVDTYPTDELKVGRRRLIESRAMRSRETMFFERMMRRKDGTLFPVEIKVGAFEDGNTHAIIRDISERRRVDETIRILARFPSENPDPVLRVDRSGQLLYANEVSYKLLTWKLQIGKKAPSVLLKIIAESLKEGIRKIIDTEHKQRIISFNVVPVVEAGYANLYGRDITEHKQAEEEIRKSTKLLEDLNKHLTEIRENERALISREIHDQIGQSLTALKLDLNWMHKYVGANPEAIMKLNNMIELVSNTIKDVQRISSELRPGILDDLGLAAAIEWYSGEFEKRSGIRCRLRLDDSTFGDSQTNLIFFRVLQEALTNVIRHANASSVSILLHQSKQRNTLTIQDNGIGISPEEVESGKSLGLIGMRERVRQFEGEIVISSKEGNGTKLTVFIPK